MASDSGSGWSVIQGINVRHDSNAQNGQVSWMPGVATHIGLGQQRLHFYVLGAFGRLNTSCFTPTGSRSCAGDRAYAILAGLVVEHRFRPR
jgi:hypothetical protein